MSSRKRRRKLRRRKKRRSSPPREHATLGLARLNQRPASRADWAGPSDSIGRYIGKESSRTLDAYRSQPTLVIEHANHEEDTARGGYAHRQLFELVQNSADALAGPSGGRIRIRLTPTHLYCADDGQPIDRGGVRALMFSHLSPKRATDEIGRFGLGFKSVLAVTDTPEFFSRSGSFRFDRAKAKANISPIAPYVERYPVLRLAEAIDPWPEAQTDAILSELMGWAANIVRLRIKPGAHGNLAQQISDFPAEFLLFVEHVSELVLQHDEREDSREFSLRREGDEHVLDDGDYTTHWMLTQHMHSLSADARSDSRSLDDSSEVPIWWAAPIDRLNDPGEFWAFFPTTTKSLLSGILNAPWKTNEDRQNLLPGIYNDELIDAAAALVAEVLPRLSTTDDPARHLDALPRRYEPGDSEHSNRLRDQIHSHINGQAIAPDQNGTLQKLQEISYPPQNLTSYAAREMAQAALQRWAALSDRPSDWLHHSALTRNRLAKLDQLYRVEMLLRDRHAIPSVLPRASIAEWIEALVEGAKCLQRAFEDQLDASMTAIQTAALIPRSVGAENDFGEIVLTADERWVKADRDAIWLAGGSASNGSTFVHPKLEADPETLRALKELGLTPASSEVMFRNIASALLSSPASDREREHPDDWRQFWKLARELDNETVLKIVDSNKSWRDALRVHTIAGNWRSLFVALLAGSIVTADGSRDRDTIIDFGFHNAELSLLKELGAVESPRQGQFLSANHFSMFQRDRRRDFRKYQEEQHGRRPHDYLLKFKDTTTSGPLEVLEHLSDEGTALYTLKLLELDDTFKRWIMYHSTRSDDYTRLSFESPAVNALWQHGRIRTEHGISLLSDGFGDPPKDAAVWRELTSHPNAILIREAFRLAEEIDPPEEPIGADAPIPLIDVWPGLGLYLSKGLMELELIRCDGFQRLGRLLDEDDPPCIIKGDFIYVTRQADESDELRFILKGLELLVTTERIEEILRFQTPAEIQRARDEVFKRTTEEERLLAAVGETELRRGLPQDLIAILEQTEGAALTGVQVAEAAIATHHTGALREYRHALGHLDPPRQWAGRSKAIEFVQSLGLDKEWAGERNSRRDPYIEVEGPYSLPMLHGYQRKVVGNVRELIRSNGALAERRGMISMPTGSGKTRVAVQAIVEAMREDGLNGGVLWVADRDELCEQAVEHWREVWASEGIQQQRLRISRMWAGQPKPSTISEMHVIVATIQTLFAKTTSQSDSYAFLADFELVVIDEAHRSAAPTFTSVMQELGLTRWQRSDEPLLIGLTATPYRGHDERETKRLVNRYGSNRLDAGAFASDDPEAVIRELQAMGVLARADHATIEGGEFSLSVNELRQSQQTPWLPRSVENRIARDADRTVRIIRAFREHIDPDWPTLVFATSVEHSQTVAALLTRLGSSLAPSAQVPSRRFAAKLSTSSRQAKSKCW